MRTGESPILVSSTRDAWKDASLWASRLSEADTPLAVDFYRIGDGILEVCSSDVPFRERLSLLYRECAALSKALEPVPTVRCEVRCVPDADLRLIRMTDAEPLDQAAFILGAFPDRDFNELASECADWRILAIDGSPSTTVAVRGQDILAWDPGPWRYLAGSVAVNRLIRLQPRHLFLHAASLGIRGRGMLLIGPKCSGKTTLSLALASRGHTFMGDEIASIRLESHEILPLRRSLAIRDGPRDPAVTERLSRIPRVTEEYRDGSRRIRAQPRDIAAGEAVPVLPLTDLVFLTGFGDTPELHRIRPTRDDVRCLAPLGATLWGMDRGRRAFDMLAVLSRSRCHRLVAGPPQKTADLLEHQLGS